MSEELRVDPCDLCFEKKIGSGGAADVWKCTWRGADVAAKILHGNIDQRFFDVSSNADFYRELQIMSRLRHPNLVLLMGASVSHSPVCIVTEYCAGGTLFDLLHEERVQLSLQQKLKVALDIAKGCFFLHTSTPPIVHKDLKSLNILLTAPVTSSADPINAKVWMPLSFNSNISRLQISVSHVSLEHTIKKFSMVNGLVQCSGW